ncbi:LOB domain-containing protein 24 [Apostasia shenzhenica]|uniref:LOB domain-containing protein 24 n=1 Tax=Apostasia shenzhenica TaxID=1088818 RepID=A0A2I0A776_9ASPA|nr:LOB domain-containing protein 24 [Apostasia shenzhenica]
MSRCNIFIESAINGGRRCAACKHLKKRCTEDCAWAPYFPHSQPYRFSCAHKIFGASNVERMLKKLPAHLRAQAADSIVSEAYWRVQDPVYGATAIITYLQQQIQKAHNEILQAQAQIAIYKAQEELLNQLARPNIDEARYASEDSSLLLPDMTNLPPDFFFLNGS